MSSKTHAGPQAEFGADQFELGRLRFFESVGSGPVAAGISHAITQHGGEKIVADVVMHFADPPGTAQTLQIEELSAQSLQQQARAARAFVKTRGKQGAR